MSNLPLIRPRPLAAALFFCCALALTPDAAAQRSRTVSDGTNSKPQPAAAKDAPAPVTPQPVKAKYEGGVFGYAKKQTGTLNFDDPSDRLVFRDKKGSEYVSLPYKAIVAAFPDTQSRRPTAATVAGSIPVPYGLNFPALFIKKKYRYLTLQFNDPDTQVQGTTSFKMDDKETVAAILSAIAAKSELVQRGEAYVRKPKTASTSAGGNRPTPE